MPHLSSYFIGTRGSLLARAQADLVRQQLQDITGKKFQLKIIKTEGDRKTGTALWQLQGQDFFTKELDSALLAGDVDLTVHSYKDLGHRRPSGLALAAITERCYGEDILLVRSGVRQQLPSFSQLVVGTSSPRRVWAIQKHLAPLLPEGPQLAISSKVLRGNVTTRLEKLRAGDYDAIQLSLAGLERLALHPSSRKKLEALLQGLDFMVLPSSLFPSAAAQGALAIEVASQRSDGGKLRQALEKLHHAPTAQVVEREREHFQCYGGGCHLAVGIHVELVSGLCIHYQRGEADGQEVDSCFVERELPSLKGAFFLGLPPERNPHPELFISDQLTAKVPLEISQKYARQCSFVTSRYCFEGFEKTHQREGGVIFASGPKTWELLARRGCWVNASSDGLGHGKIGHYLKSQALGILGTQGLPLVTYSAAGAKGLGEKTVACYRRSLRPLGQEYARQLAQVRSFFWASYPQFELFRQQFPDISWERDREHCCGMGKTFQEFKKRNIRVTPFIDWGHFIATCTGGRSCP